MNQTGTEPVTVKGGRRTARWVVLGLAAAVVLGGAGWFVWLVAVELRTEKKLHDPMARLSHRELTSEHTFESYFHLLEAKTGVRVEADLPEAIMSAPWPVHDEFRGRHSDGRNPSAPRFDAVLMLNIAIDQVWTGERLHMTIEGDCLVITTSDNAPRFDASAKAREWWRALEG